MQLRLRALSWPLAQRRALVSNGTVNHPTTLPGQQVCLYSSMNTRCENQPTKLHGFCAVTCVMIYGPTGCAVVDLLRQQFPVGNVVLFAQRVV